MKRMMIMGKISNDRLAKLSSMERLRKAQARVDREIYTFERNMRRRCDQARDVYSFMNVVYDVLKIVDNVQSFARYAKSGYRAVRKDMSRR